MARLYRTAFSFRTGLSTTVPKIDQVPQLLKIKFFSSAGTAATALAVSWLATDTTLMGSTPSSLQVSGFSRPMTVPGWTIAVNSREGIPKASVTRWDQVPFAASKSWVVVQLVYSEALTPVSI